MSVVTNRMPNPSIEVDATGYSDGGSPANISLSRITTDPYVGDGALAAEFLLGVGDHGFEQSDWLPAVPGDTLFASVQMRRVDGPVTMYIISYDFDAAFHSLRNHVGPIQAIGTGYTEVSLSWVAGADTAYSRVVYRTASGYVGTVVCDAFALMDQDVAYFDGDTADGGGYVYDWTGTANASTSTRTSTGLSAAARMRRSNFELRPAY